MGLDWIPIDIAKPGYESEREKLRWRISWNLPFFTPRWKRRYNEIVIAPFECVGAPKVGFDAAADEWARNAYANREQDGTTEAEFMQRLHGYHVLELVNSPGVPQFTNGGAYDGVDLTSFRGQWVISSKELITDELANRAYSPFSAAEAVDYSQALVGRAAEVAKLHGLDPAAASAKADDDPVDSIEGQIEIFRAASDWFAFWGGKGHCVEPWA